MYSILKLVEENAVKIKDKIILADGVNKDITSGEFYEQTGKVYSYLKKRGIGKEDFVLILLPREYHVLSAIIGVWRAGAAYVMAEDTNPLERIEFIKKDCSCKLVIDANAWVEIMKETPLEGHEKVDEHDVAFALYTSGTSGNPKGAVHECGNVNRFVETILEVHPIDPEDRFALSAPLNFMGTMDIMLCCLMLGAYQYFTPYSIVKNQKIFLDFLNEKQITATFLSASYIRSLDKKPPTLKYCMLGGEQCDGVFLEGLRIFNYYVMSESCFVAAYFIIDKKYEHTPAGKPGLGVSLFVTREDGTRAEVGEEGEVCFENPYFRGYLNLPEQTAEVMRDGYYHTGDLGKFDEEGRLFICGRIGDMTKINGNRVEPGEIENVAKKVLNLEFAAVKIIQDENRTSICLYYPSGRKIDYDKAREDLGKYMPYFMIPSVFIPIDTLPMTHSGKFSRNALPNPSPEDYQKDYIAPTNEVERKLCEIFAKVLDIKKDKIGIKDDFYLLGGDSMAAIIAVTECNLPELSVTDIFEGRTPKRIALIYNKKIAENPDAINDEAMKRPHLPTVEQSCMIDSQRYSPDSTIFNVFNMLKFDKNIMDMEKLTKAVSISINNYPSLMTEYFKADDGKLYQHYTGKKYEFKLEKVSETELLEIKKTLVQPYAIENTRFLRCRLFETEEAGYWFIDFHHIVADGASYEVFIRNVLLAYEGKELEKDYYYYILDQREKQIKSGFYESCKKYFEDRYGDIKNWSKHISTDFESVENKIGEYETALPISVDQLDKACRRHGLSRNSFFCVCAVLSNAIYDKKSDVMISWCYNGRTDKKSMQTIGFILRELPIGIRIKSDETLGELCSDIVEQIKSGIEYSSYPYVEIDQKKRTDESACVIYQGDIEDLPDMPGIIGEVEVEDGRRACQNIMDIEIHVNNGMLSLFLDYAGSLYKKESIEKYSRIYCAMVKALVNPINGSMTKVVEIERDYV